MTVYRWRDECKPPHQSPSPYPGFMRVTPSPRLDRGKASWNNVDFQYHLMWTAAALSRRIRFFQTRYLLGVLGSSQSVAWLCVFIVIIFETSYGRGLLQLLPATLPTTFPHVLYYQLTTTGGPMSWSSYQNPELCTEISMGTDSLNFNEWQFSAELRAKVGLRQQIVKDHINVPLYVMWLTLSPYITNKIQLHRVWDFLCIFNAPLCLKTSSHIRQVYLSL